MSWFSAKRTVLLRCLVVWFVAFHAGHVLAQGTAKPWCKPFDVPKEHAELGRVYYVVPATEPQMTFEVKAQFQAFKGTTNKIEGYLVAPKDGGMPAATALAGRFCLPVASIETGEPTRDVFLETEYWLDSDNFPEIIFKLTKVRRANEIRDDRSSKLFGAFLEGDMTIAGHTKHMTIPTRITLIRRRGRTAKTDAGDLMKIHAVFGLELRDFEIEGQEGFLKTGRMTTKLKVEVNLKLSTVRPKRKEHRVIPFPKDEKTTP